MALFRRLLPWLLAASLTPLHAALVRDDLSVSFVSRLPKIDYVWDSKNPTVEGWPAEGSTVTWVAHTRWLGGRPLTDVPFRWSIDGVVVEEGSLDFAPSSMVQTELPWTWTRARHEIVFELDPENVVKEVEERNNSLLIHTDSVAIGLWVERSFWDSFSLQVIEAKIGGVTFDDFAQKQVRRFNEMAAHAIFPDTPQGVLERWRIDEIHFVEDGSLPLTPPFPEARDWGASPSSWGILYPNVADHSVDIQWGFPASTKDYYPNTSAWLFTIGTSLVHEFAHARTMIDVYAWNLSRPDDDFRMADVPPMDAGHRIYSTPIQGMMHLDWGHIDRYTAAAMNRMAGRRAILGNYNEPWDLGWFLNDFPERNRVRFVRRDASPIANRAIRIYQPTGEQTTFGIDPPYRQIYEATPSATLTTDANGEVLLGRNPISAKPIMARVDQANGTAVVVIDDGPARRFAFLESLEFNLAYWRGDTEEAHYEVMADPDVCYDRLGPGSVFPPPEALATSRRVTFDVYVYPGRSYDLFYSVDGAPAVTVPLPVSTTSRSSVTLDLPPGRVVWWFTERSGIGTCPPQHSSIYAFDHIPLARQRPVRR